MMAKKVSVRPCKICQDVGKSESECINHRVKDENGNTTCPTLLNTECRYCFKLGHTTKYCDVLAKHNKEKERSERRNQVASFQSTEVHQKKPDKAFAGLYYDSDSEDESHTNNTTIMNKYSNLGLPINKSNELEKSTWVAVVLKPREAPKPKAVKQSKPVVYAPWATSQVETKKKRWADWSDSEDEDE